MMGLRFLCDSKRQARLTIDGIDQTSMQVQIQQIVAHETCFLS